MNIFQLQFITIHVVQDSLSGGICKTSKKITSNLAFNTVNGNSVIPTIVLAHAPTNTDSPMDGSSLKSTKTMSIIIKPLMYAHSTTVLN